MPVYPLDEAEAQSISIEDLYQLQAKMDEAAVPEDQRVVALKPQAWAKLRSEIAQKYPQMVKDASLMSVNPKTKQIAVIAGLKIYLG